MHFDLKFRIFALSVGDSFLKPIEARVVCFGAHKPNTETAESGQA